jgi:hypothetical protein
MSKHYYQSNVKSSDSSEGIKNSVSLTPTIPPGGPIGKSRFEYKAIPIQLGMNLDEVSAHIENHLNSLGVNGFQYRGIFKINSSEGIIVFMKENKM